MRLAAYNVENLFTRARALNQEWADGRKILEAHAELTELLEAQTYSPELKARMLGLLTTLGLDKTNESSLAILREVRGTLILYPRLVGTPRLVAGGRRDWIGWIELKTESISERAMLNTAQVVRDVAADVIAMIEVEDRHALTRFSSNVLPEVGGTPYDEVMLVDGNDDRGIGIGIMARNGYRIGWMRSHAEERDPRGRRIFGRDCSEYSIWTPAGGTVWVLVNHLKSKGYGQKEANDARRTLQAQSVSRIYERLKSEGASFVAVVGDLNDTPDSDALAPLLKESELKDISAHPTFKPDGYLGTFGRGTSRDKIDYLLLSPKLFERVRECGVWRKGVWGPNKVPPWEIYPEMRSSYDAASDHAALWCELDV